MFDTNLELGVLLVLLDLNGFGVLPSGLDQKFLDLVDLLGHVPISKIRSLEVSNSQIFASNRQKKKVAFYRFRQISLTWSPGGRERRSNKHQRQRCRFE